MGIANDGEHFGAAVVQAGQELLDGGHQVGNALEEVIVRDLAAQVFPEPLDQIELGRIGGQGHHAQAVGILGQHFAGLLRTVNDVIVDNQGDLGAVPGLTRAIGLNDLVQQTNEAVRVLALGDVMCHLPGHEVDSTKAVAFHILTGCWHLALLATPGPTAEHTRQQVEIDFVFEQQVDLATAGLGLELFERLGFDRIIWVWTGNREYRSHDAVAQVAQVAPYRLGAEQGPALPSQILCQVSAGPGREGLFDRARLLLNRGLQRIPVWLIDFWGVARISNPSRLCAS